MNKKKIIKLCGASLFGLFLIIAAPIVVVSCSNHNKEVKKDLSNDDNQQFIKNNLIQVPSSFIINSLVKTNNSQIPSTSNLISYINKNDDLVTNIILNFVINQKIINHKVITLPNNQNITSIKEWNNFINNNKNYFLFFNFYLSNNLLNFNIKINSINQSQKGSIIYNLTTLELANYQFELSMKQSQLNTVSEDIISISNEVTKDNTNLNQLKNMLLIYQGNLKVANNNLKTALANIPFLTYINDSYDQTDIPLWNDYIKSLNNTNPTKQGWIEYYIKNSLIVPTNSQTLYNNYNKALMNVNNIQTKIKNVNNQISLLNNTLLSINNTILSYKNTINNIKSEINNLSLNIKTLTISQNKEAMNN